MTGHPNRQHQDSISLFFSKKILSKKWSTSRGNHLPFSSRLWLCAVVIIAFLFFWFLVGKEKRGHKRKSGNPVIAVARIFSRSLQQKESHEERGKKELLGRQGQKMLPCGSCFTATLAWTFWQPNKKKKRHGTSAHTARHHVPQFFIFVHFPTVQSCRAYLTWSTRQKQEPWAHERRRPFLSLQTQ